MPTEKKLQVGDLVLIVDEPIDRDGGFYKAFLVFDDGTEDGWAWRMLLKYEARQTKIFDGKMGKPEDRHVRAPHHVYPDVDVLAQILARWADEFMLDAWLKNVCHFQNLNPASQRMLREAVQNCVQKKLVC